MFKSWLQTWGGIWEELRHLWCKVLGSMRHHLTKTWSCHTNCGVCFTPVLQTWSRCLLWPVLTEHPAGDTKAWWESNSTLFKWTQARFVRKGKTGNSQIKESTHRVRRTILRTSVKRTRKKNTAEENVSIQIWVKSKELSKEHRFKKREPIDRCLIIIRHVFHFLVESN